MFGRWSTIFTIVFWLAMMTWLMAAKVVPLFLIGDPPDYRTVLEHTAQKPETTRWQLLWNQRKVGLATTKAERRSDDVVELHSQVILTELPVREVVPAWLRTMLHLAEAIPSTLTIKAQTRTDVDALGNLIMVDSVVNIGDSRSAGINVFMQGTVSGHQFNYGVRIPDFGVSYSNHCYMAPNSMVGGVFSLQPDLGNLRVGQKWTVPMYNPLSPRQQIVDMLQATVAREELISWHDELVPVWVVVYNSEQGTSISRESRGRMWVRRDGVVLQQEASVLGSQLLFVRENTDDPDPSEDSPQTSEPKNPR